MKGRCLSLIKQHDEKDCGAACLAMICKTYGLHMSISELREMTNTDINGTTVYGIVFAAQKLGFDTRALTGSYEDFFCALNAGEIKLPIICLALINEIQHFIIISKISSEVVTVYDPAKGKKKLSTKSLEEIWLGAIIQFKPNELFTPNNKSRNEYTKYFRIIRSQSKLFGLVLVISLVLSFISLICSFIYEYIINGVLSMDSATTDAAERSKGVLDSIINSFLSNSDISTRIAYVSIIVLLFYLIYSGGNLLRGYFFARLSKRIDLELVIEYYRHIIDLPVRVYATRKNGELLSRINDTAKVREAISNATLSILTDSIRVITLGIILCLLSLKLSIVVFSFLFIYIIVFFVFRKPIKNYNQVSMENSAQLTAYVKETLDGIETVKLLNSQEYVKSKNSNIFVDTINSLFKGSIIQNAQSTVVTMLTSICAIIILWFGTYEVLNNLISLGTLITYVSISTLLFEPVKNLINLQPSIQAAVVAADRLNDLLEIEIEKTGGTDFSYGDLSVEKLTFRYGVGPTIISDISLSISKGSCIAIIGESGSGKTTLAKLFLGLYDGYEGSIQMAHIEVSEINKQILRDRVGYISQDVFFFSDTIYNNIRLGDLQISDEAVQEACKNCQLNDFIDSLPFGYNTILEERGTNLSCGQRQRLAIARALVRKPDILIFDEATSNLDTLSATSIEKTIKSLNQEGTTCIIITHRLNTIKRCDTILVMDNGRIIEEGTHLELMENRAKYYSFLTNSAH